MTVKTRLSVTKRCKLTYTYVNHRNRYQQSGVRVMTKAYVYNMLPDVHEDVTIILY